MTDRRLLLRAIFDAAVARAHPDHVLAQHLPPPPAGRIVCLAAGKGAAALAAAAERHYLDTLHLPPERLTGLATTRHGHAVSTRRIEVIEAGHPVPDAASQNAAERTLQFAREAQRDDLVLALLSGGGSANWIAPVDGVSLAQKQGINRALLRSGANIGAMNAVRKHLPRIKGGRLAREAQPAPVVTLAISDVPDDDPAVIASGPTVPDPTTLSDARDVLARFDIVPDEAIAKALNDPSNESCKAAEAVFANHDYQPAAQAPSPDAEGEDYTPDSEAAAPRRAGETDEDRDWIAVFSPADPTLVSAPSDAQAQVVQDDGGAFLRIRSGRSGSAISFDVGQGILDRLAGRHAVFDIVARAEDGKDTQMSVDCNFGDLGDCGRKRYAVGQQSNEYLFDVAFPDKQPGAAGTIAINSDFEGQGRAVDIYAIRVSVAE